MVWFGVPFLVHKQCLQKGGLTCSAQATDSQHLWIELVAVGVLDASSVTAEIRQVEADLLNGVESAERVSELRLHVANGKDFFQPLAGGSEEGLRLFIETT